MTTCVEQNADDGVPCGERASVHIHVTGRGYTGISLCGDHAIRAFAWNGSLVRQLSNELVAARVQKEPEPEAPCDLHTDDGPGCIPDLDAHTSECCIRRGIAPKQNGPEGGDAK